MTMDLQYFLREAIEFIKYVATSATFALSFWIAVGALLLLIFRRASIRFVWRNLHLIEDLVLQREFFAKADKALKVFFITLALMPFFHFMPALAEVILSKLALLAIFFSIAYTVVQGFDLTVFSWYFKKHKEANVPSVIRFVAIGSIYAAFALVFLEMALGVNLLPLLATSTILTAVLGLAMQDTLKNLFAGITLSFEKRLRQGDWITFRLDANNTTTGQVLEIGWRTTKIRTLENTFSVIPNSMFATNHFVNYSTAAANFWRSVEIQAPLATPVEEIVTLLANAAVRAEGVAKEPHPDVILSGVKVDHLLLRVRFNITDFAQADVVSSLVTRQCLKELETLQLLPPAADQSKLPVSAIRAKKNQ